MKKKASIAPSYTDVFGRVITELAAKDKDIVTITAAMKKEQALKNLLRNIQPGFLT